MTMQSPGAVSNATTHVHEGRSGTWLQPTVALANLLFGLFCIWVISGLTGPTDEAEKQETWLLLFMFGLNLVVFGSRWVYRRRWHALLPKIRLLDPVLQPERMAALGLTLTLIFGLANAASEFLGQWVLGLVLLVPLIDAAIVSPHVLRDLVQDARARAEAEANT